MATGQPLATGEPSAGGGPSAAEEPWVPEGWTPEDVEYFVNELENYEANDIPEAGPPPEKKQRRKRGGDPIQEVAPDGAILWLGTPCRPGAKSESPAGKLHKDPQQLPRRTPEIRPSPERG